MQDNASKGKLIASMALFGTIGVFVRFIPLPSGFIAMCRGVVGMLFLPVVMAVKKQPPSFAAIRRNLAVLCLSGAALGINWMLLFEAYRLTTVATATLCNYMAPIGVILLSPLFLKEKLTPVKLLCAAAALVGLVLVSGVLQAGVGGASAYKGVLFALGAAVMYVCVVLLNKRLRGISPYDATAVQLCASALVLLPYTLLTETVSAEAFSARTVVLLVIVCVVHTGAAYTLYFGSIQRLPAQTVSIYSFLDPLVAVLLSVLALGERMDAAGVIGAVLILGSTLAYELTEARRNRKTNSGA